MKILITHIIMVLGIAQAAYTMQPPVQLKPVAKPAPAKLQVPLQAQPPITQYNSAGILPFAVDSNGQINLLVGLENRPFKNGPVQTYAMDFGGKLDPQDNNNPLYSAAREGSEELAFIYDETPADFKKVLDARKKFGKNFNVRTSGARSYQRILQKLLQDEITGKPALYNNNNNFYVMYFPRFSYRDIDQLFQNRIQQYGAQIPHDWHEKNRLVWLNLKDLINAIKARSSYKQPIVVNSTRGPITLWPYFADSVTQAYQRGILENLR